MDSQFQFNQAIEEVIASIPEGSEISPLEAAAFAYVEVLTPFLTQVMIVDGVVGFGLLPFVIPAAQKLCDHMRGYFGVEEFDTAVASYVMMTMADVAMEQVIEQQYQQP
jgi:hypothetical protein